MWCIGEGLPHTHAARVRGGGALRAEHPQIQGETDKLQWSPEGSQHSGSLWALGTTCLEGLWELRQSWDHGFGDSRDSDKRMEVLW